MSKFGSILAKNNPYLKKFRGDVINITENAFKTTKDKVFIQHAYATLYPKFYEFFENTLNVSSFGSQQVTSINKILDTMKTRSLNDLLKLLGTKFGDMGPGEVLMYLLHDQVRLAGNEPGDLRIGTKEVELKAAKVKLKVNDGLTKGPVFYAYGMGSVNLGKILDNLTELRDDTISGKTSTSIDVSDITTLLRDRKDEYKTIEKDFQKETHKQYFSKHQFLFIGQASDNSRRRARLIGYIPNVKKEDITIESYSRGQFYPQIRGKVLQWDLKDYITY